MGIQRDVTVTAISYGVLALVGWIIYKRAKDTGAFDPTSDKNLAYKAANAFGTWMTGNPNFNTGASVFELFTSQKTLDAEAGVYEGAAPPGWEWAIDPVSHARTLVPAGSIDPRATWDARDYQNAQAGGAAVTGRYPGVKGLRGGRVYDNDF